MRPCLVQLGIPGPDVASSVVGILERVERPDLLAYQASFFVTHPLAMMPAFVRWVQASVELYEVGDRGGWTTLDTGETVKYIDLSSRADVPDVVPPEWTAK